MIYVGIDPGQKGGVAFISEKGEEFVIPMPSMSELNTLFMTWDEEFKIKHVFLEKSQAMPKQGVVSMFNYGEHFGTIQGILIAHALPYTLVPPKEWQKEMFKGTKQSITDAKEKALEIVRRIFPKQKFLPTFRTKKPHDGMIDSILIAEFCRRKIL